MTTSMNIIDSIDEQWHALCEDQAEARRVYFQAFRGTHQRFVAIGEGRSRENPTTHQVQRTHDAYVRWQVTLKRMREFAKSNA